MSVSTIWDTADSVCTLSMPPSRVSRGTTAMTSPAFRLLLNPQHRLKVPGAIAVRRPPRRDRLTPSHLPSPRPQLMRYLTGRPPTGRPVEPQGDPMSTTTWIVLGVIVLLVLWIIVVYNGLVAMRQRVN